MRTFNTIMNACNLACKYCYLGKDLPTDKQAFDKSLAHLKQMFQPETISTLVNGGFNRTDLVNLAEENPGIHVYIGQDQLHTDLEFFKQPVFATSQFFISRFNINKESELDWLRLEDRITLIHVLGPKSQHGGDVAYKVTTSKIMRHYVLFEFPFSLSEYKPVVLSFAGLIKNNPDKIINMDLCYKKATGRLKIWEDVDPSLEIHPDGKIRFCDYTGELYDPLKMTREEIMEASTICNRCPYLKP